MTSSLNEHKANPEVTLARQLKLLTNTYEAGKASPEALV